MSQPLPTLFHKEKDNLLGLLVSILGEVAWWYNVFQLWT